MTMNIDMLMQYLSAGGAAMSQGQQMAPALNQITQQNIQSQSYAGLLQQILGGGGKMTMDKDKFSLSGKPELLQGQQEALGSSAGADFANVNNEVDASQNPAPNQPSQPQSQGLGFLQQLLQGVSNPKQAL